MWTFVQFLKKLYLGTRPVVTLTTSLVCLENDVPVLLDLVDVELHAPLPRLVPDDAGDDAESLLAEEVVVLLQFGREVLGGPDLQDLKLVPLAPHEEPGTLRIQYSAKR